MNHLFCCTEQNPFDEYHTNILPGTHFQEAKWKGENNQIRQRNGHASEDETQVETKINFRLDIVTAVNVQ